MELLRLGHDDHAKPKLSKEVSWLVGVEVLSEWLKGVPQFSEMEVEFHDHPFHAWNKKKNKPIDPHIEAVIRDGASYPILRASCSDGQWSVFVYPVAAKKRSAIREIVKETAVDSVRAWLAEKRDDTWFDFNWTLDCVWDPVVQEVTVSEEKA